MRNPDCQLCQLHKFAQHVCLIGDGPVPCKVMVVGEAPGSKEDIEGRPFIGRAGVLLEEALNDGGWFREEVYITNTVKCRPPDNRTPSEKEADTCSSAYLSQEFEVIKPNVVMLLGNTALRALTGQTGITGLAGSAWYIPDEDLWVCATFHPAAALRSKKTEEQFRIHMRVFSELAKG